MPSPASIAARFASSWRAILGLRRKPSGTRDQPLSQLAQQPGRDPGVAAAIAVRRRFEPGPGAFEPVRLVRAIVLGRLELGFEPGDKARRHRLRLALGEDALGDQALGIDLPRRRMAGDRAVHQRLGEGRLVALVVPVAAIAEQVDDDVLFEFAAVFGGDAGDRDDRFGIVAVDVKDRRLHALGDIGRVGARTRGGGRGGKADLVVDDDVDRAAGAKSRSAPTIRATRRRAPGRRRRHRRASGCRRSRLRSSSPCCCCLARTLPSTTGSTASRCDGLAASDR